RVGEAEVDRPLGRLGLNGLGFRHPPGVFVPLLGEADSLALLLLAAGERQRDQGRKDHEKANASRSHGERLVKIKTVSPDQEIHRQDVKWLTVRMPVCAESVMYKRLCAIPRGLFSWHGRLGRAPAVPIGGDGRSVE